MHKILKIVLEDGEPVVESIESYILSNDIGSVIVYGMEGMIKKTCLRFYSGKNYKTRDYEEPLVVKAASGQFNKRKGEITGELYLSLKKDDIHSVSGALLSGRTHGELEIHLRVLDSRIIIK